METLLILNDPPYGTERSFNGLRLAKALAGKGAQVTVFLMADAVACAKAGQKDGAGWDEAHKGSFDKYLAEIAVPQTREILTRIKPDVLWWDTPHLMTPERAKPLHDLLALRPGLITNNRLGGGFSGDGISPTMGVND